MASVKLTALETRAKAYCQRLQRNDGGTISVDWKKSASYGNCPSILDPIQGGKVAHASGCGYDKISAVLSDALEFLAPEGEHLHKHGCGLSAVQARLREWGWELKQTANGKTYDVFQLSRIEASSAAA